jgi:hypothetical protein
MLGRVDTDPDNLAHGRLPSFETFDSLTLALDAGGGPSTPTIQTWQAPSEPLRRTTYLRTSQAALDCFAPLAMTARWVPLKRITLYPFAITMALDRSPLLAEDEADKLWRGLPGTARARIKRQGRDAWNRFAGVF